MVENVNYKFAKMVRMLPAVHRWCVTGTPIQNDLRGSTELNEKKEIFFS